MHPFKQVSKKICKDYKQAQRVVKEWQKNGEQVVFTNGCFDIMHYGHLHYLCDAKAEGTKLIVAINAAASVSRLRGSHRPINDDLTRLHMLASLRFVDAVVEFHEDTPLELLELLVPNVLVKGGDWAVEQIVGHELVVEAGGVVKSLPFVEGYSTTNIEAKIKD